MPSFLDFALRRDRGKKSATPPGCKNDSRDDASVTSRCTSSRTSDHCSSASSREQIFAEKSVHTDRHDHLYNHHRTFHPHQSPVLFHLQSRQVSRLPTKPVHQLATRINSQIIFRFRRLRQASGTTSFILPARKKLLLHWMA